MEEWLTFSTVKDVVLFLLAIWGAALSTFIWRQSVRRDQRAIRIDLSTARPTDVALQMAEAFVVLKATNTGQRPVTVANLGFHVPTRERLPRTNYRRVGAGNTGLPTTLSDGQSAHLSLYYRDIGEALIESGWSGKTKLTPVAEDSVGEVYKGKAWKVDPKELVDR